MRRIIAFFIDHMILSITLAFSAFLVISSRGMDMPREALPVATAVCMIPWLGYFLAADYYFHGMTIGKKLMGLRMVWGEDDGPVTFKTAILHTLLKWLLTAFYPIGLILYLILGCKMPYDKKMGITYTYGGKNGKKIPAWKIAVGIFGGLAVLFIAVIVSVMLMLQKMSSEEYYTVKTENISTVTAVFGKQRLTSYSGTSTTDSVHKEYQYMVKGKAEELAQSYEQYLIQNEGFEMTEESDADNGRRRIVLSKESGDGRYEITMVLVSASDRMIVVVQGEEYGEKYGETLPVEQ